jgi:hypothetical protein
VVSSELKRLAKYLRRGYSEWRRVLHNSGAGGGNRTLMGLPPRDFASRLVPHQGRIGALEEEDGSF